ncbi:hypothetical protein GGU10DRAFT_381325 [Lentinula aff. detonsa]|uniref:Uncharacterized protein n=1 Tax=Lentinula aff. detonsa TaxID=2804958 RepID=A0AA38L2F8_9AGAR|nr:hypothetical protein GGU10DRAFT_381325 [Lentinula aff. detonsa]
MGTDDGDSDQNFMLTGSNPGLPGTPPEQQGLFDPEATPTQHRTQAGSSRVLRQQTQSSKSKPQATDAGKRVPRRTRATSKGLSETMSSDDNDPGDRNDAGALLEPLEKVFNQRLVAFERKFTEANSKFIQEMVESNNRLIADFKTTQSQAIETSVKTAVASGIGEGLAPLTESLKTIDKNQRMQTELLIRLASSLDRDRSSSRSSPRVSDSSPSNTPHHSSHNPDTPSSPLVGQQRYMDDEDGEDGCLGSGGSDDEVEEETKFRRNRKVTKTKKELILQENIRNWLNDLIGGQQYSLNVTVTAEEAANFETVFLQDPVAKPCTIDDFRYCVNGKPTSAWNKGAAFLFVDYVKQNRLMKIPNKKTYDLLRKGFMTRVRTLHGYYLKSKLPKDKRDENVKKGRKYGRKSTIFYQRRELLNSLDPLRKYLRYFDLLGIVGMSSDEEDEDVPSTPPKYKVTRPLWRGSDVENFFQWLDACHVLVRMPSDSPTGARYSQGAPLL